MMDIPFNKPHFSGKELEYISDAVQVGKISGNGKYTQMCQRFFEKKYGFGKCLLTTSCTDALEMAALLINIQPGDEVILPSYTFVSTANAFILRGATLVFADSRKDHPGLDEGKLEKLITSRTKAIVPVHYAGVACDMDKIMALARKYDLFVIEDAAHAIDSYYVGRDGIKRALGSIGHLATFSFHETKNISSGEGGMIVINHKEFMSRAETIWEKGTNRSAFFRGEVNKYGWIDIGSSFLPSEIIAAFLWAQVENIDDIQKKRREIWNSYYVNLSKDISGVNLTLPFIPGYATNNAHLFYIVSNDIGQRNLILGHLRSHNILAVFHYQSLHKSLFYTKINGKKTLPNAEFYTDRLIRLPFYYGLNTLDINQISKLILKIVE